MQTPRKTIRKEVKKLAVKSVRLDVSGNRIDLWQCVNRVTGKGSKHELPDTIHFNGKPITTLEDKAEQFAVFFKNKVEAVVRNQEIKPTFDGHRLIQKLITKPLLI